MQSPPQTQPRLLIQSLMVPLYLKEATAPDYLMVVLLE